jgi:hypothetical protein
MRVEKEPLNIGICRYRRGIELVKWLPQCFKLVCVNQAASSEQVLVKVFVIVINGRIGGRDRWKLDRIVFELFREST